VKQVSFVKRVSLAGRRGSKSVYHLGREGAFLPPIVVDHVDYKSELVLEETIWTNYSYYPRSR
jgi:hypothetical protein